MHVVALNQVYRPSPLATAQLLTELAEGLVRRGHAVTIITAKESAELPTDATEQGVRVLRVGATRFGKSRLAGRAADYATFYLSAARALATLPPADVYLPLTTPPLVAALPQIASAVRGVPTPVVAVIQDLYPDVAVALGAIPRHGLVHRAWAWAAGASLRHAARVVALSPRMAARIQRYGVPSERIDVIANWALAEVEIPGEAVSTTSANGKSARLEYGIGDRFSVMYSGNMGHGHSFDTLLAAARRLAGRPDIAFVFVGDGARRGEIEAAQRELPNVRLFPLAPRARLAESLAAGDLHVVTLRDDVDGLIVPSKLYGILAAARPILSIGPAGSDVAAVVMEAKAGVALANGDTDGVVAAIERFAALPDRGRAQGQAGRRHLVTGLSREQAIDRYADALGRAVGGRAPHPTGVPAFDRSRVQS